MEKENSLLDTNYLVLKTIAQRTKVTYETISESFPLYRRDLLFSNNYSNIIIPIFNDSSIKDVIENINLISYLREKYKSRIILVLDKRSSFNNIYYLFGHLIDKIISCKRYIELHNICIQENATKLIYNKSNHLFEDFDYYMNDNYILLDYEFIIKNSKQEYPNAGNIISIRNTKNFCSDIRNVLNNVKDIQLTDISQLDKKSNLIQNLNILINAANYINISSSNTIDYIVPFLGINIIAINTGFYLEPMFKYSASTYFKLINTIRR